MLEDARVFNHVCKKIINTIIKNESIIAERKQTTMRGNNALCCVNKQSVLLKGFQIK